MLTKKNFIKIMESYPDDTEILINRWPHGSDFTKMERANIGLMVAKPIGSGDFRLDETGIQGQRVIVIF